MGAAKKGGDPAATKGKRDRRQGKKKRETSSYDAHSSSQRDGAGVRLEDAGYLESPGYLLPEHERALTGESGIPEALITSRGYQSIGRLRELPDAGWSRAQHRLGLLVPTWWAGEVVGYQLRPDKPRQRDDKIVKYETPHKAKARLDCHPAAQPLLGDATMPLWITEGVKKGDAAVGRGLVCIALSGVWNWMSDGEPLADWSDVSLKGRRVFVAYDSDVMVNPQVEKALRKLTRFLEIRGAEVLWVYLPADEGEKVGLDDYLAAGGSVDDLIVNAREPDALDEDAPLPHDYEIPYPWSVTPTGIFKLVTKRNVEREQQVAHAPLYITERWVDDEGAEALCLTWKRDGTWRHEVYDRDDAMISRNIVALARDGAPVGGSNPSQVANYLVDVEAANIDRIPVRRMTRRLGWVGDGTDLFVASLDDSPVEFHGLPGTEGLAEAFRRSGSLEGWQRAVSVLREHPRAALGIYASLAAPLLRVVGAPPFTNDWSGETSLGKTTTVRVAASVWGSPELMRSWDATKVAIEHLAGTLSGLPLLLDETKRAHSPEQVGEVIYNVSQGFGRARGARGGGLRETVEWSTIVLSTGEQPITTFTRSGGARARVVSVWGSPFETRDQRMVRELQRATAEHYGHAGPLFVRELLAHRDEWSEWRARYEEVVDELAAHSDRPVVQRRAALVAVLRMAAGLAEKFGVLDWKPERAFWPTLLTTGAGAEDDDQPREALGQVWEWAAAHEDRFSSFAKSPTWRQAGPRGWAGRWDTPTSEVAFLPYVLRQILEPRGHASDAIVQVWTDRNWLRPDSAGQKNQRVVRLTKGVEGKAARMYVIREEVVRWLSTVGPHAVPAPLEEGQFPPSTDDEEVP